MFVSFSAYLDLYRCPFGTCQGICPCELKAIFVSCHGVSKDVTTWTKPVREPVDCTEEAWAEQAGINLLFQLQLALVHFSLGSAAVAMGNQ